MTESCPKCLLRGIHRAGCPAMKCPECGEDMRQREDAWPDCESCGFVQYDEWTLQLQNEVKREQAECKRVLGYVPSYKEAKQKGLAK